MPEFEEQLKKLNDAQRAAVEHTEGPVLVIAGPGTGKTQLLSTRAAYILRNQDVLPHNLLCLTFTESGAFAMRQRLVNIIGQQAYNITISTYHAFGSELISRFPDFFAEDLESQPIDELGMHRIIRTIIADLPYDNPLKNSDFYIRDVLSTISEAKQALLSPADIVAIAKANETFISTVSPLATKELAGMVRVDKKSLAAFNKLSEKTANIATKSPLKGIKSLAESWHTELVAALEEAEATSKTTPVTAWKNNWLTRDSNNNYVVDGASANRKLLALAEIYKRYLAQLQEEKLYDYDDMILKAINGLVENPELKYRLQEQYLYVMLDEFQDTNGAQLQLVRLLTDNPLYERKPNVLAVGDDDQAIYAFQGADYSHMRSFTDLYDDVFTVTLTKNYRSHKDILDTAHNISEQIEERLHHAMPEVNKTLEAAADNLPERAAIARHEFKSDVAQFAWITKEIATLLEAGTPADEIAVIAPQHKYLEPLLPYLAQASIPVRYEKRENILEDTHVIELVRMSQLVIALGAGDLPTADSLWPEILSYDFWELATDIIWETSWEASDKEKSWVETLLQHPETKTIADFFTRLGQAAKHETLETVLDYLIGNQPLATGKTHYSSPFYQYYFSSQQQLENQAGFWNLLSNITVLRQHLRSTMRANRGVLYLNDFVQFVQDHEAASIKVLNTSPYHESAAAVQLMTAYKAKGLEFKSVFLVACMDEAWGSRKRGQSSRISLPPNLSFIRYAGATDDEKLRLLFVAITRAKENLYLTNYANTYDNKPTTRLKYFNEIEEEGILHNLILPPAFKQVLQTDDTAPTITDLQSYWTSRHVDSAARATFQSLLKERLDRFQLAASHVTTYTDVVYSGPQAFFLQTLLRFPSAPTAHSIFGNLIHKTLEWLHQQQKATGNLPALAQTISYYEEQLSRSVLSQQDKELLKERGSRSLKAVLQQLAESFKIEDEHEFNFRSQGVFLGHAHLTGKIDKLSIDTKARTIKITDYKTGKSFETWKSSELKLHHFRQQLYFYKLLVEGSYAFADYTVTNASIQFVEPDDNGKLHELQLEFTVKDQQNISKLITAIFNQIKALDFPDIEKYPLTIQGVRAFEADLIESTS
jgi:DNA helicase-2/ATP-dependent DNA helicase PcrA